MGDDELDESNELGFDPLEIVRYSKGPRYFGVAPSTLKAKIDTGEIPPPIPCTANGIALGWTRQTIADHHTKMAKLAADRRAAAALIPTEKRPKPPALVKANKMRKRKLGPPTKQHQRQRA